MSLLSNNIFSKSFLTECKVKAGADESISLSGFVLSALKQCCCFNGEHCTVAFLLFSVKHSGWRGSTYSTLDWCLK